MAYDLGTAKGTIQLTYDGARAAADADKDIKKVGDSSKKTDKDVNRLGQSFKKFLGGAGKGAGIASLAVGLTNAGAQAAALGVQLLGVVPALTSILSLSSALPAAFAGGAAAVGTFKAIMAGVPDTLAAAFDPEGAKKFEEGLKQLSPAAREFAMSVKEAVPALKEYQQGLQETFFSQSGLADAVPKAVSALGQLKPQLTGMATDFANITKRVVQFGTSSESIRFISDSIGNFRAGLTSAAAPIETILTGLRDVGTVGGGLLTELGVKVGDVGQRFGEWLSAIAGDGRLEGWIDQAITTLSELGGILKNVGSILNSVFSAAAEAGGGLLGTLELVTGEVAAFLKAPENSQALVELFGSILAVAKQLAPVFTTLASSLVSALGPALARIAQEVGPVLLEVVNRLAPAFEPLANAIADLLVAVAPLAVPLAELVSQLAILASGVVSGLASEFGPLISVMSDGLLEALRQMAPVIQEVLVRGLPIAAEAGLALAEAFRPLVPLMVQFGTTLAQALLDNLPQLLQLTQQLVPLMVQFGEALAGSLGQSLQMLIPILPKLVSGFVSLVSFMATSQSIILRVGTAFITLMGVIVRLPQIITNAVTTAVNFIRNGLSAVATFIGGIITRVVAFFASLPPKIGAALAALPGRVWNLIKSTMTRAVFLFGAGIGLLITAAVQIPRKIGAAIQALPATIVNIFKRAMSATRAAFASGISAIVAAARALPGRVRSAISSLGSLITSVARTAVNGMRNALVSGFNSAVALARSLPGRIRSAVGNLVGLLASAGRDAVAGFVNGIRNGVGAVGAAARSLGSTLLKGVMSTLDIGSPSKEMIKIGKWVNDGLIKGLNGTSAQVKAAADKMAQYVLDAYSDKLISKRKRNSLISAIKSTNKQLQNLIKESTAVASKLAKAQEKLNDIRSDYNQTYQNAANAVKGSFNITEQQDQDKPFSLAETKKNFKLAVIEARKFADNIKKLTKRGLNKDLIQQLLDAGPEQGGAMAEALANADNKTIKEFNDLQKSLNDSANKVGKTAADSMYGAGLRAAEGLVKGLQKQQKQIDKEMDRIADRLVNRIKKALKIKSPSRVMFRLGQFTTEGLADGIRDLRRQVERAAEDLATSSIIPTIKLGTSPLTTDQVRNISGAGAGATTQNIFQQTVNALPGQDARQVANYTLAKLRLGLQSGITAANLPAPSPAGA